MCVCVYTFLHVHVFFYFRTGREPKDMQMESRPLKTGAHPSFGVKEGLI